MQHALLRHPDSPPSAIARIGVSVAAVRPGRLTLTYHLAGKIDDIAWPAAAPSARADRLWQHTCFEAFLRRAGDEAYCEYNFSPSTEWAAYSFTAYRAGMQDLDLLPPQILAQRAPDQFTLEVQVEIALRGTLQLALTAVIEERGGTHSYWALHHPAGKPDFHHCDGFAPEIDV